MIYPNYFYRYNAYYNQQMKKKPISSDTSVSEENDNSSINNNNNEKRISRKYNPIAFNLSSFLSSNLEEPILEILGIKLYFDDILILGLLLFLYEEGVKDEMLFICLILLLLT